MRKNSIILFLLLGMLLTTISLTGCERTEATVISSMDELNGKRVGIITGSSFDQISREHTPDSVLEYYNSAADLAVALNAGKIDYYLVDEPVARLLLSANKAQTILGIMQEDRYGVIFSKSERGTLLCGQLNAFLAACQANGSFQAITDRWLVADTSALDIPYEDLTGENGVLEYAFSSLVGAPYAYVQNGKYAGFEIEFITEFCRTYGYRLHFSDSNFLGMLAAVSSGRCDIGSSGISITDERKESVLFSDPIYESGIAVVVRSAAAGGEGTSFFGSIAESFEKTFIRENRWVLFLRGIARTLLITVAAAVLGSGLGFCLFLLYRKKYRPAVAVIDALGNVLGKTPVVVFLMILYYILFGEIGISGTAVSVIGFTLLFAFSVLGLLKAAVGAVDFGQTEAALALGYTDSRAFLGIVLPQALRHFMPGFKTALVSLIKDTAVVGYIAVQDLTKISDIVRSRTYEPFFPLIATAVIYFLLAALLIRLVEKIQFCAEPLNRKPEAILKGVRTK